MDIDNLKRASEINSDVKILNDIFESYTDGDLLYDLNELGSELTESALGRIKRSIADLILEFRNELLEEAKTL